MAIFSATMSASLTKSLRPLSVTFDLIFSSLLRLRINESPAR